MGGLLTLPAFTSVFPEIDTTEAGLRGLSQGQANHRSTIQGISIGSYNVGCFCGAIACIWIGDILGRRKTIFLGSSIMIVGAILQASAFSLAHLIVGRIITGMGNGLNTSTVPTWQSECSKSHRRGQLVMVEGALITGGICECPVLLLSLCPEYSSYLSQCWIGMLILLQVSRTGLTLAPLSSKVKLLGDFPLHFKLCSLS
jgi:MFS family permease